MDFFADNFNDTEDDNNHSHSLEFDIKNANDFDKIKRDLCLEIFLAQYPDAKDYEIVDFIDKARRSYVRAMRKNISESVWIEHLKNHIKIYNLIQPLQRELDKVLINQEKIALELEHAKLAKEKAMLEKQKIDFIVKQSEYIKNNSDLSVENKKYLITVEEFKILKKEIEDNYINQLNELKTKQNEELRTVIDNEIIQIKNQYNKRIEKLAELYNAFKEKYKNLVVFNNNIYETLNLKNNEFEKLQIELNKMTDEIKNRENKILEFELLMTQNNDKYNKLLSEKTKKMETLLADKDKEIKKIYELQSKTIKNTINEEFKNILENETDRLNSLFLTREKNMNIRFNNERKELNNILTQKQKEIDQMSNDVANVKRMIKSSAFELERVKKDYDLIVNKNQELQEFVKNLKNEKQLLNKEKKTMESKINNLIKTNDMLTKKYEDLTNIKEVNKKFSNEVKKINNDQEHLINKKISSPEISSNFDKLNEKIKELNQHLKLNKNNRDENIAPVLKTKKHKVTMVKKPTKTKKNITNTKKVVLSNSLPSNKPIKKTEKNEEESISITKLLNIE